MTQSTISDILNLTNERQGEEMELRKWLELKDKSERITFIIKEADREYRTTPIRNVWEWLDSDMPDKYKVICENHPPIDITGDWMSWYKRKQLLCAVIMKGSN